MSNLLFISGLTAGSFVLTAVAIPFIKRLAWSLGLVDDPAGGEHKSHRRPVPYGGGMAIYLGVLFPVIVALLYALREAVTRSGGLALGAGAFLGVDEASMLLGCASVLFLIGLLDDWKGLTPLPRFLIEVVTAAILVIEFPEFRFCGDSLPLLGGLLSVIWIVAMTNAFNFLDNMDGLTAGIAVIATLALAAIALDVAHLPAAILCFVLAGATVAFLIYNFPPASVFMGDAGGLFLGFAAAGLSLLASHHAAADYPGFAPRLAPLLVLAVPVYDLVSVVAIRIRAGVPVWVADNNHVSHRLVRLGLTRRNAVLFIYAVSLVSSGAAVFLVGAPAAMAWAVGGGLALATAVAARLELRRPPRAEGP